MNSNLLGTSIKHFIVNWTNDTLNKVNTKEEFGDLLTTTFGNDLITNNVNGSTFVRDNTYGAVSLTYGKNHSSLSRPSASALTLACKTADSVFSANTKIKPKQIQISIMPKSTASRALFALCFIGKTTEEVNIPFAVAHTTSTKYSYVYTNNFNKNLNSSAISTFTQYTIDIAAQCPNLFLEQDTEWEFKYVNVTTYVGANSVAGYPIYINELIIE